MRHASLLLSALAILAMTTGCGMLGGGQPTAKVVKLSVQDFSLTSATIAMDIQITNPSPSRCRW